MTWTEQTVPEAPDPWSRSRGTRERPFVSPHAVQRFRERVCPTATANVFDAVVEAMKGPLYAVLMWDKAKNAKDWRYVYRGAWRHYEFWVATDFAGTDAFTVLDDQMVERWHVYARFVRVLDTVPRRQASVVVDKKWVLST